MAESTEFVIDFWGGGEGEAGEESLKEREALRMADRLLTGESGRMLVPFTIIGNARGEAVLGQCS